MHFLISVDDTSPAEAAAQIRYHLHGIVSANRLQIGKWGGRIPPLYRAGIRYQLEEHADEWQRMPTALEILAERSAACMGASAWRLAELKAAAATEAEAARYDLHVYPNDVRIGGHRVRLWHVVVRLPDGSTEDPSKELGG